MPTKETGGPHALVTRSSRPSLRTAATFVLAGFAAASFGQAADAKPRRVLPDTPALTLSDLSDGSSLRQAAAAEAEARAAVAREPGAAGPLYRLGEVLMRRNEAAESLTVMTRAAALQPPTGEQLRIVGLDYILLDDATDAIHWFTEAAKLSPADAELWYSLGRAQYTKGLFAAAEASFRRSIAIDAASAKAEDNLGLALAAQNRNDEAIAAYTRAIACRVAMTAREQPWLNRGTLLLHTGQPATAVPDLLHAVELAPKCAECHEAAGEALLALERLPEARSQMEQATRLDPKNPRFHYELGRLYKRLGEARLSEDELSRSRQLYGTRSTPAQ